MQRKISVFFDANPLLNNKSGVGHFTHRLVQTLAEQHPDDLDMYGHYFNFRSAHTPKDLPTGKNLHYEATTTMPIRAINLLRRVGIDPPVKLFHRSPVDIAIFPNYMFMNVPKHTLSAVVVHDLAHEDLPHFVSKRNCDFLKAIVPRAVKKADIVVAVSEFTKQRIQEVYGTPTDKIYVMYNPPRQSPPADSSILKKHGLKNFILFVSTLEPRKNVGTLIQAYSQLDPSIQEELPLVLAGGKGWRDEEILAQLSQLKAEGHNIITTGYVSDTERTALYEAATICVMPSHYEGFGMPILEAMSFGRPMICSDIPVFHEVAKDAALYFDKDNTAELTALINKMLADPKALQALGAKGKRYLADYPTWPEIADDFYKYMQDRLKT